MRPLVTSLQKEGMDGKEEEKKKKSLVAPPFVRQPPPSSSHSPPSIVQSVCLSVLQHGPRVNLGCRSNEFLDHART